MWRFLTLKRFLQGAIAVGITLVAIRLWTLQGLLSPVRVVSGSMVERLLGEHFVMTCNDCGFVFRFGTESPPKTDRAFCPNCGFAAGVTGIAKRERGDSVLIDRAAYLFNRPKRFDLVAFRDPRQPDRLVVKRVMGLPGEKVAIRHGDLYINGAILRKTVAEYEQLAQSVHDNNHRLSPQHDLPERWRAEDEHARWRPEGRGFRFVPENSLSETSSDFHWLEYHHWRCFASPLPRTAEAPVADNYGYNQGESRELRETVDLVLSCRAGLGGDGEMALRIHDGRERFMVVLNRATNNVKLLRGEAEITATPLPADLKLGSLEIKFGLIDRQVVLAIGRRELLRQSYEPGDSTFKPISNPVAIGGRGSEVRISDVTIRRDTYYLDPWSVGQTWQTAAPLGEDEYLVLGDNPPISDDSRRWSKPSLSSSSILGRVIRWNIDGRNR